MERPELDDRSYKIFVLSNQLEVLVIHDPTTDKASAAVDVGVGSFSDPDDIPGLAHAVEHMILKGTKKHPEDNGFQDYIAKHAGDYNAHTHSDSTIYWFEVAVSSTSSSQEGLKLSKTGSPLYGALDRFAQFFIESLFLKNTVDRELHAVDSENNCSLQSDTERLIQLNRTLSNTNHPYHRFTLGNYETLHNGPTSRGVQIRDEMINFYKTHYSANTMKLVVLGRESVDDLYLWVEELFTPIANKGLEPYQWGNVSPLTEKELNTVVFAKPISDIRRLQMDFPHPDEEALFESKPASYLSHLIGHEGPGSILAYLKDKGFANLLEAGQILLCRGSAFFRITIGLTENGLEHHQEVIKVVFQYISMLKEASPQQQVFDELKQMRDINFRFMEKAPACRTTSELSGRMQRPYPRDWLLSGPILIRKFDPEAIKDALGYLRPDNFRLTIVSQKYPGNWDQEEQWYGTQYKVERMPANSLSEANLSDWPSELHLPDKNEFIPTRLEVKRKDISHPLKYPKLIWNHDGVRTWYKKDDRFWVPKTNLYIMFQSPFAELTPHAAMVLELYIRLVDDAISQFSYAPKLAGLDYSLRSDHLGFQVTISGYSEKMAVLLTKILMVMRDLKFHKDRFHIVKDLLLRRYKNWGQQPPSVQIGTYFTWLIRDRGWMIEDYLNEIPHIKAQDIHEFSQQLLRQLHIELLAHGNLEKEKALAITDLVQTTLQSREFLQSQWPIRRSLVLPAGANYYYGKLLENPRNVEHCVEYTLYVGNNQDRNLRARLLLLAQIAEEPCFDHLRTKDQLGYSVFSRTLVRGSYIGYSILVQSQKPPKDLEDRIENFLTILGHEIKNIDELVFEEHKKSITDKLLERPKNLDQETNKFWGHILSECYDFEEGDHDTDNIAPCTKQDIAAFYDQYISPTSTRRAKLSVQLIARPGDSVQRRDVQPDEEVQASGGVGIKDVRAWKSTLQASQGPMPVKPLCKFLEEA